MCLAGNQGALQTSPTSLQTTLYTLFPLFLSAGPSLCLSSAPVPVSGKDCCCKPPFGKDGQHSHTDKAGRSEVVSFLEWEQEDWVFALIKTFIGRHKKHRKLQKTTARLFSCIISQLTWSPREISHWKFIPVFNGRFYKGGINSALIKGHQRKTKHCNSMYLLYIKTGLWQCWSSSRGPFPLPLWLLIFKRTIVKH